MKIDTLHDRAIIFVDGQKKGIYDRRIPQTNENTLKLPLKEGEQIELTILVENMGRVIYGPKLLDKKGISCVRFGNQIHFGWKNYPLPMNNLDLLCYRRIGVGEVFDTPTFFRGYLEIEGTPADTFLELPSFKKGFVTVNGINIGRYYNEAGPQKTLYVPAPFLKEGKNEIVVFESDASCGNTVEFFDTPML